MLALDLIPPTIMLADIVSPPDSTLTGQVLRAHAPRYHWFVAETKTRQEKAFARYLTEHSTPNNLGYYLPYLITKSACSHRVFNPMLPGFVFVAVPNPLPSPSPSELDNFELTMQGAKDICRESRATWGFIPILQSSQARFCQDIIALSEPFSSIEPSAIAGQSVIVIAGLMQGMAGTLVNPEEQPGQTRVLFNMQVLGQPYSTLVETEHLRPLDRPGGIVY